MNASTLLVSCLEEEGLEYIFGVPEEENLHLVDAIRKSKIRLIATRHEQTAGFMAATQGRISGKAGACFVTIGQGATNLATAAAYAQLGGMPMVMLATRKSLQAAHPLGPQKIDVLRLMETVTKFAKTATSTRQVPALTREAFRKAEEKRSGATLIELPEDVPQAEEPRFALPKTKLRSPIANDETIFFASAKINRAKLPLIMLGAGIPRCGEISTALTTLLDQTGIPFFTTQLGKGAVNESHSSYVGSVSLAERDRLHKILDESDCLICFGHDGYEKPAFLMHAGDKVVIHVSDVPAEINEYYFPDIEVIGETLSSIQRFRRYINPAPRFPNYLGILSSRRNIQDEIEFATNSAQTPLHPLNVVLEIWSCFKDGIVCLDNGLYKLWFVRYFRSKNRNSLLVDNSLATMGAGLPSAIAAKLAHVDLPVVAVCGDGGFLMNSQELETAVRLQLDLTVVILKDDSYGMIEWKQRSLGLATHGVKLGNPQFSSYARSYGTFGYEISNANDFSGILAHCISTRGVHVIEVPIDYQSGLSL